MSRSPKATPGWPALGHSEWYRGKGSGLSFLYFQHDFPKGSRYKLVTWAVVNITKWEHNIKKKRPVATVTSTSSSVNEISSHPVATIMGFTSNPARYTTINASTILSKDDEEEEELDSDVHICNTLIKIIDSPVIIPPKVDEADTPLTVPHLFWWASCSPINDLLIPYSMSVLI